MTLNKEQENTVLKQFCPLALCKFQVHMHFFYLCVQQGSVKSFCFVLTRFLQMRKWQCISQYLAIGFSVMVPDDP